jgi:hypothetical protein
MTMFQGVALHATDRRNAEKGTFMIVERKKKRKKRHGCFEFDMTLKIGVAKRSLNIEISSFQKMQCQVFFFFLS